MKKVDQTVSCYKEGFSCSQAVLSTYSRELGLDREIAMNIAAPFSGGMAQMGETCGAVTGAFMVLGLKYATGKEERKKLYKLIYKFADEFKSRNSSLFCKELLGHNMNTSEGMKAIQEKGLFDTLCPKFVKNAAEILDEIINNEEAV